MNYDYSKSDSTVVKGIGKFLGKMGSIAESPSEKFEFYSFMYEISEIIKLNRYSDEQIVWRYMDFTKFLSMLQYQSLFFCTCKKMQEMDPFEGEYPKKNLELLKKRKDFVKLPSKYTQKTGTYRRKFLENVSINCWHANDTENAAMWRVYLSSQEGIAIKSSIKKPHLQGCGFCLKIYQFTDS